MRRPFKQPDYSRTPESWAAEIESMESKYKGRCSMVRAKFVLQEKTESSFNADSRTLVFRPQYDTTIPEDQRFSKATPSGEFKMQVDNPAALEQLKLGQAYYFDITPAS
jgi:hypothetical protein